MNIFLIMLYNLHLQIIKVFRMEVINKFTILSHYWDTIHSISIYWFDFLINAYYFVGIGTKEYFLYLIYSYMLSYLLILRRFNRRNIGRLILIKVTYYLRREDISFVLDIVLYYLFYWLEIRVQIFLFLFYFSFWTLLDGMGWWFLNWRFSWRGFGFRY